MIVAWVNKTKNFESILKRWYLSLLIDILTFHAASAITNIRWPTRDTLQTKKKPPKQKRKHANKTETTQIKKKPRKQKKKTQTKKRDHAHKTETTQTKQKTRKQNRNHAHKTETAHTKQKPRKQKRNSFPEPLRIFLCCFADQSNRGWRECFPPSVLWSTVRGVFDEEFRRCSAHAVGQN